MLGRYYLRNCTRQEIIMIIIFMKPLTSLSFSFFFRRGQGVCVCVCVGRGGNYQTEWLFPNGWWLIYSCWSSHTTAEGHQCVQQNGGQDARDQWAHQHSVDVKTAVDRREVHQVLSTQFLHDNQAEKQIVLWGWLILICTTLLNVVPLFVNTSMNGFI